MTPRLVLQTQQQYEMASQALYLLMREPDPTPKESALADELASAVAAYEETHFRIPAAEDLKKEGKP